MPKPCVIFPSGHRFGRLVVEKFLGRGKDGRPMYRCKCDCGVIVESIYGGNLRKGHTRSCGCLQRESTSMSRRKPPGEAALNYVINSYKQSARARGIEFLLSREEFKSIASLPCEYCGALPIRWNPYLKKDGSRLPRADRWQQETIEQAWININGIDRVDSSKDYTADNCVPCCRRHNVMKMDRTLEELILEDILPLLEYAGYEVVKKVVK